MVDLIPPRINYFFPRRSGDSCTAWRCSSWNWLQHCTISALKLAEPSQAVSQPTGGPMLLNFKVRKETRVSNTAGVLVLLQVNIKVSISWGAAEDRGTCFSPSSPRFNSRLALVSCYLWTSSGTRIKLWGRRRRRTRASSPASCPPWSPAARRIPQPENKLGLSNRFLKSAENILVLFHWYLSHSMLKFMERETSRN